MSDRWTLATSSGLPLVILAFHVAMGVAGLATGTVAIVARKGGAWHRRSGIGFVWSMIAMALSAVVIALYEGATTVVAGAVTAYLVLTAYLALKEPRSRLVDAALMLLAFGFAATEYYYGFLVYGMPGHKSEGVPAGMIFFMGTVVLLAAIGDARMISAGGVQGTRRIARHLWRMCFGLFIALGSFTAQLVKMPFIPPAMRSLTVILVISTAPLLLLLYWMWKVRLRKNLRGLVITKPMEVPRSVQVTPS
jgi:hypothetical protein